MAGGSRRAAGILSGTQNEARMAKSILRIEYCVQ
jgi:hypothetical protein